MAVTGHRGHRQTASLVMMGRGVVCTWIGKFNNLFAHT